MPRIVLRVEPFAAGQTWRLPQPPGFFLGPSPYGYGITWYRSQGRVDYEYHVAWPEPYDPVRFEWEGNEYVIALDGAGDREVEQARLAEIKEGMAFG
jgi:hypothetical protein